MVVNFPGFSFKFFLDYGLARYILEKKGKLRHKSVNSEVTG